VLVFTTVIFVAPVSLPLHRWSRSDGRARRRADCLYGNQMRSGVQQTCRESLYRELITTSPSSFDRSSPAEPRSARFRTPRRCLTKLGLATQWTLQPTINPKHGPYSFICPTHGWDGCGANMRRAWGTGGIRRGWTLSASVASSDDDDMSRACRLLYCVRLLFGSNKTTIPGPLFHRLHSLGSQLDLQDLSSTTYKLVPLRYPQ
jgi:hypothetical protein